MGSIVNVCIQDGKKNTKNKEIILENINQQYNSKKMSKIIVENKNLNIEKNNKLDAEKKENEYNIETNIIKKKIENEYLINNVKSKYILNYIFYYIKEKNFKDKLFLYSKILQIKFDIKLIGLKENYLKKIKFDLDKYLYIKSNLINFLAIKYNKFIIEEKINKEKIENIIYDIFENKEIKDIDEEDVEKIKEKEKFINIESPLFKILSKTKNFGKIFTIHISQKIIDVYKLKNKYIKLFENLNNLNIKYLSIFYDLEDINKIDYLKEINIKFNKIKKLTIENDFYYKDNTNKKI